MTFAKLTVVMMVLWLNGLLRLRLGRGDDFLLRLLVCHCDKFFFWLKQKSQPGNHFRISYGEGSPKA